MKRFIYLLVCALFCVSTFGSEKLNSIHNKLINAYGGQSLINADSIKLTDYRKSPWPGQGESAQHPDFFRHHSELTIDLKNKRKSLLSWRVSRSAKDLDRLVYDGKKGRIYDILNGKYSDESWLNFNNLGSQEIRLSDTLLARKISLNPDKTKVIDQMYVRGELHTELEVTFEGEKAFSVFINNTNGLISKMLRQSFRRETMSYVFSNHQKSGPLTLAKDVNVFIGSRPSTVSIHRDIELVPKLDETIFSPSGFAHWGERFDTSKMTVNKLATDLYHVGQGWSYSLVVDGGDHLIASGGRAKLTNRLEAFKDETNLDKPLKYFVLTHHHTGQLQAAAEALELGATVIAAESHVQALEQHIGESIDDDKIMHLEKHRALAGEKVQIQNISTAHASEYALIYLPEHKIIFAEDHYDTELKTAAPRVHKDMLNFRDRIEGLNLQYDKLVGAGGLRVLSKEEFENITDGYRNVSCPQGFDICIGE